MQSSTQSTPGLNTGRTTFFLEMALAIVALVLSLLLCSCGQAGDHQKSTRTGSIKKASRLDDDLQKYLVQPPRRSLSEARQRYLASARGWQDYKEAALKAMQQRDYESAETLLDESIRMHSTDGEAYFLRGRARVNGFANKDDAALTDFQTALDMGAGGADAMEYMAKIFDARKQPDKAIEILTKAIPLSVKPKHVYRSRATLYLAKGKKKKALADYNKVLEIDPRYSLIYLVRGQLHESMGNLDAALEDYHSAARYERRGSKIALQVTACKASADLLSRLDRHGEAIKDLSQAIEIDASNDELLRLRGDQYAALRHYKKAVQDYTKAIELSPDLAHAAYEQRSKAYKALGKSELAGRDRKRAAAIREKPAEKPIYSLPSD